jgi:mono/diheme cytochrome c family protein
MQKPWYDFMYVKSPITKIILGTLALGLTLVLFLFQWWIEEPRMSAQTASWEGRTIENGAALYSGNCASCHGIEGQGAIGVAPALQSRYFFTNRISDIGYSGTLQDYIKGTVAAGRPSKPLGQWAQHMPVWSSTYGGPMRQDQVEAVTQFVLNWEAAALMQAPEDDPWIPFEDGSKMTAVTGEVVVTQPAGGGDGGVRDPETLFVSMGCAGCHNLEEDQTANNVGPVAPHLGNIDELGGTYVAGEDAATYVHNSIVNPNEFVHPGYVAGIMPQNFTERMSDEEITALAEWILEQAAAN